MRILFQSWRFGVCGVAGLMGWCVLLLWGQSPAAPPPSATSPATTPATLPAQGLPHISIDRQHRTIDLEATVVLREAKWLELLACSPKSREHESILTVPARPSHIHVALLMLGLEAGSPMRSWLEGDEAKWSPPHGPKVRITILYEESGKRVEVPANEWIINQNTHEPMKGNIWLFAGSAIGEVEGEKVYYADLNGTVVSLVNFGDDLLSRDTTMTNDDDNSTWGTRTEKIPPVGTKVTLRLTPVDEPTTKPADQ